MLHPSTLLLVLIVFTTVTTLLVVAAAMTSDALQEQRYWAMASVSVSLGFAIGSVGSAPAWIHAGLSYGLIGLGLALALRGLRQFCGLPLSWNRVVAIALGAFLPPLFFAEVQPDKAARMIVSGLYLGVLCAACALTVVRSMPGSPWSIRWASTAGFALIGMVMLGRAAFLLAAPHTTIAPADLQTLAGLSILCAAVAQVMVAYGLIMLVSHRYSEKLSRLTLQDGLTGVLNRAGMEYMGQRVLMRARQDRRQVAIVMVDADFFKAINDTYGHPAGDQVLIHLARTLSSQVRPGDLVIRYGGEEFLLVLSGPGADEAALVAERLRRLVEESSVATAWGDIRYRVSIGVSSPDAAPQGLQQLVAQADAALYRAKEGGRNQVCIA